MRVLFVPIGSDRAAGPRYRVYQYRAHLARRGVESDVFPAVSDFTTRLMLRSSTYGPGRRRLYYAWVLLERALRFGPVLLKARGCDVVFLQRATYFGLERLLRVSCDRLIFDFDDAIFMSEPGDGERSWVRRAKDAVKAFEVVRAIRASRAVVVENEYLRSYAEGQGASVVVIPGPIDTEHFVPRRPAPGAALTVGWIGSPSTAPYLDALHPVLARLAAEVDFSFKTIGAGEPAMPGVRVQHVPWAIETELAELQTFDVGVMPMPNDAWTLGKLGAKMLLYMSIGVPCVASYTSTNAEVIRDGENGFLVKDADGWHARLSALARDPALRRRIGDAGRATIERDFSLRAGVDKLAALLAQVHRER